MSGNRLLKSCNDLRRDGMLQRLDCRDAPMEYGRNLPRGGGKSDGEILRGLFHEPSACGTGPLVPAAL
jgi:hypothetical protein